MEHLEISVGMTTPSKSKSGLMKRCYLESSDYKSGSMIAYGFTDEKIIQYFPFRGKLVYLHEDVAAGMTKLIGKRFPIPTMTLRPKGRNSLLSSKIR